jgi:dTDP-4-dehydrorhamnose reductase
MPAGVHSAGAPIAEDRVRVLVTGSNGLLGNKLLAATANRPEFEVVAASRGPCANRELGPFRYIQLNVTDGDVVREAIRAAAPDVVIHTAAMTDVDGCERDPERAFAVNVRGTDYVARACAEAGAMLVHLSTEYVFDGRAGPYSEADPPNPISVYGRTKLESEAVVATTCDRWAVARTTVLFGYAASVRANFVLWLLDRLAAGEPTRVVADQVGSPTLADNLAEMVLALAERPAQGVYHTVGASRLGRYEFARLVAQVFGLDPGLIQPISTAELRQPAPRPLDAGLCTDRLRREIPTVPLLTAEAALERLRAQLEAAGRWPAGQT